MKIIFPVDCEWDSWSSWSPCSKTCDEGIESRTRTKRKVENSGGICAGSANDQKSCKMQPCPGKYFIQTVCLNRFRRFLTLKDDFFESRGVT